MSAKVLHQVSLDPTTRAGPWVRLHPALQSNDAGNVPMPESSDEGAYERALLQEAASEDGSRPSVDAFMRHLTEYIHSSHHQTVTLPTSSCGIGTESETAPALQPDADASAPMLASSAEVVSRAPRLTSLQGEMACHQRSKRSCDISPSFSAHRIVRRRRSPRTTLANSSWGQTLKLQKT